MKYLSSQKMTENKIYIISKCVELIRTFNPVIYSIDTFVTEHLGDTSKPVSYSES